MKLHPTPITLRPGQPIRLPSMREAWLMVLQGRVWLTRRNDADDHFLEAGESLRLTADAQAVLEADGGRLAHCVLQAAPLPTTPMSAPMLLPDVLPESSDQPAAASCA